MVSNTQISVEIDKSKTGGTFTNYDVIRGTVHLKVGSEITLNSIQVKLEGVGTTHMYIKRVNGRGKQETKRLSETHKLLYDTSIVFPPKNVRDVATSSKFTLIPGEYSYSFQFKIPLKNSCFRHDIPNGSQNHTYNRLPPSISGLGEFATIKYFIKVTANRSSLFKMNLRSYDPFVFLPIDSPSLLNRDEDARQSFVRKEIVFPNKIPEIVACYAKASPAKVVQYEKTPRAQDNPQARRSQGFLKSLFFGPEQPALPVSNYTRRGSANSVKTTTSSVPQTTHVYRPKVKPIDLPVYFEARFKYPAYMIPTKRPNFKLYFISKHSSQFYELPNGESSGLGYIYMKSLQITLHTNTKVHIEGYTQDKTTSQDLLKLSNVNYKFDLHDVKIANVRNIASGSSTLYELEIPKEVYKDAIVPDDVAPTFRSCNIERSYSLSINTSFSSGKRITSQDPLISTSLITGINIYSGLQNSPRLGDSTPPPPLLQNQSSGVIISNNGQSDDSMQENQVLYTAGNELDDLLPSYEEVLDEDHQDDRRRRFQQTDNYYQE